MRYSYTRVNCFKTCPYRYYLQYVQALELIPDNDDPANALFVGKALHTGVEKDIDSAIAEYYGFYPVIGDLHINEAIKLELLIPRVKELVNTVFYNCKIDYEVELRYCNFIGYIDALVQFSDGNYGIFDFKYTSNPDRYLQNSTQLQLYKWMFQDLHPDKHVTQLGYIFVPKTAIRQKKDEDLYHFRMRLEDVLNKSEVCVKYVLSDLRKLIEFHTDLKAMLNAKDYPKHESNLCNWCSFKSYCQNKVDYMILPQNQRRTPDVASRKKVWFYGMPFSGKTTLADQFPNALMLNTDGNINSFTSPYVSIADHYEGRIFVNGWQTFVDTVNELQKGNHSYETIVVDLIEDVYQLCRNQGYEDLGIKHESDSNFKAWDYIRTKFLSSIKDLMTLPYNIVLISHEDASKDLTMRSGEKVTSIRPNIQDKLANKLAGMVDLVCRVIADGDSRTLNFKATDVIFGGGRLRVPSTPIACTYAALDGLYKSQQPFMNTAVTPVAAPAPTLQPAPVETSAAPQLPPAPQYVSSEPVVSPTEVTPPVMIPDVPDEPVKRVRKSRRVSE